MKVREDSVVFADGSPGRYGVVEKPDFAVVIARAEDDRLWLVHQHRYPVGGSYWELPQGSTEGDIDADPLAMAQAELAEETGLRAKRWSAIGWFFPAYGFNTQKAHVFVAEGLQEGRATPGIGEMGMVARSFSRQEVNTMVLSGEIADAVTLAALNRFDLTD